MVTSSENLIETILSAAHRGQFDYIRPEENTCNAKLEILSPIHCPASQERDSKRLGENDLTPSMPRLSLTSKPDTVANMHGGEDEPIGVIATEDRPGMKHL